jgi:hypothetical protein
MSTTRFQGRVVSARNVLGEPAVCVPLVTVSVPLRWFLASLKDTFVFLPKDYVFQVNLLDDAPSVKQSRRSGP